MVKNNRELPHPYYKKKEFYFDIFLTPGVFSIGTLSIFRQFSNYANLDQFFDKQVNFSLGSGYSNAEYFFQVTLWNLWIAVALYIVIVDIIIKKRLGTKRDTSISPLQGVMNRMFATLAVGISLVYWGGMGVPKVLFGDANAFYLLNTFCLHFLIPMIALLYYYTRNKEAQEVLNQNENNVKNEQNSLISKLERGELLYWLGCFGVFAAVFTAGSFALQYWIAKGTPVYDLVNWQGGPISLAMAISACIVLPFAFTAILYIMHVDKNSSKYLPNNKKYLRPFIFGTIISAMSFTITYGALHQCAHLNIGLSLGISAGVVLLSLLTFALVYKKLELTDAFIHTFPKFFDKTLEKNITTDVGKDITNIKKAHW